MLTNLKQKITKTAGRQLLVLSRHSPVLMFGVGTVGVVATVVLASRATLKMDGILKEGEALKADIEKAKAAAEEHNLEYSEDDVAKDGIKVRVETALKVARIYAPAFIVGAVSIGLLTGSHIVLTKRYTGMTAAYAAIDQGFRKYRERVVDKFGKDVDVEMRYGATDVELAEDNPDGSVSIVDGKRVDMDELMYARIFSKETSRLWQREPGYNQIWINCQESTANAKLLDTGHVMLNEVYDMLGLARSSAGARVGWVLNRGGDNRISFRLWDDLDAGTRFVNGYDDSVLLDFNVDGPVDHLLDELAAEKQAEKDAEKEARRAAKSVRVKNRRAVS